MISLPPDLRGVTQDCVICLIHKDGKWWSGGVDFNDPRPLTKEEQAEAVIQVFEAAAKVVMTGREEL